MIGLSPRIKIFRGENVEKSIQKWSIYGFLISLALSVLFVDNKVITHFDGGYTTEYVPVYDYFVSIIRYSVIGAFIGLFVGWRLGKRINRAN
ncbi:hypothetical protein [Schinkia azotoformans]|uniref:hypothetical protein n=1 Tax=Schinkia azotoformans TaxID=1454 RepID=UPI002DB6C526|nr:hypothetical protein [Schinkia azotoformans]MEC1766865.1 hypothetical protein [Schinkia azotoformans]MEC1779868.1 hypothetical protein [Schinkia azotoformans]MEC1787660.1 hypothetical protein [Schinkia azotoformans]MED4418335.1 hypothetical protein [Schinkia azotoformans]